MDNKIPNLFDEDTFRSTQTLAANMQSIINNLCEDVPHFNTTSLIETYCKLSKIEIPNFANVLVQFSSKLETIDTTVMFQNAVRTLSCLSDEDTIAKFLSQITHEVLSNIPENDAPNSDYVIADEISMKEWDIPETLAIPIGHNRIKIKFDTLIAIIGIIISLFALFKPSSTEQEQIILQQTEVQILSEILDSTEATDPKISEKLNALKESVDELNSSIEQCLKENSESENIDSKNK